MSEKCLRWIWPVIRYATPVVFFFVFYRACQWVGHLFGLLIGASTSPIAATVIPLVFGLLAVVGIGLGAKNATTKLSSIWYAILVAIGISVFCESSLSGISHGVRARIDPDKPLSQIIDVKSLSASPALTADLYELRWKLCKADVYRLDAEAFLRDVATPILEDRSLSIEKKRDRIREIAAGLSVAEPKK